jgi:alkylation response protein AidB-like acyl-CoA dehydrogenase
MKSWLCGEVRPMRIYEGATEVRKLVVARDLVQAYSSRH